MKRILIFIIIMLCAGHGISAKLSGNLKIEGLFFSSNAFFQEQKQWYGSSSFEFKYCHEHSPNTRYTFAPFIRKDFFCAGYTHVDIRELNYLYMKKDYELLIGISKVFWGATEFIHLVDIINQTDSLESFAYEDKLGQPMINFSIFKSWGVLETFVLPYFRPRVFRSTSLRLRPGAEVDDDNPLYESSNKKQHIDWAVRYKHSLGTCDFGIHHFKGTNREPKLIPFIKDKKIIFVPFYTQIEQSGIDLQWALRQFLLKVEAIYQQTLQENFFADIIGIEYNITGLAKTGMDINLITEWAYDNRGNASIAAYQNDIIVGFRLVRNDIADTKLRVGMIHDIDNSTKALRIDLSRRIKNIHWSLGNWTFFDVNSNDIFYQVRQDDFLRCVLTYYF